MIEDLSRHLCLLKKEFAKKYTGTSHIQEFLPMTKSKEFPIEQNHLDLLHTFAKKNPIYHNYYSEQILSVPCTIYEGDINEYWLNSIKHGSSCQPFYPTWILSAYILSLMSKKLGFQEIVDIGSGDGRIAYCGKVLELTSYGFEIDEALFELQKKIASFTKINFNPNCADALEYDYSSLSLSNPVFFIGGLPQMGGDILANSIIDKISFTESKNNAHFVFAGSDSKRHLSINQKLGGWSSIIDKKNLKEIITILLPTVWTFDQETETPYIFTSFNQ